jgi:hypothetical protein
MWNSILRTNGIKEEFITITSNYLDKTTSNRGFDNTYSVDIVYEIKILREILDKMTITLHDDKSLLRKLKLNNILNNSGITDIHDLLNTYNLRSNINNEATGKYLSLEIIQIITKEYDRLSRQYNSVTFIPYCLFNSNVSFVTSRFGFYYE